MSYPSTLKVLFNIFNVISLIIGVCVILVGVYQNSIEVFDDTKADQSKIDLGKDHIGVFCTEYMTLGTIMCLVSIFGLISAATKSIFCFKLYAAMNLMIIIGLIITSVIGFMRFDGAVTKLSEKFIAVNFNHDKYNERKNLIDEVQKSFSCCGNTGPENYDQAKIFPSSCCLGNKCSWKLAYDTGCKNRIPQILNKFKDEIFGIQKTYFIAIVVGAGIIELIGGMLAFNIVHSNK